MKYGGGLITPSELIALISLCNYHGDIMEIGCNAGYTTKALALAYPNKFIYAVDLAERPPTNPDQAGVVPSWEDVCHQARNMENVVYINCNTRSKGFFVPKNVGIVFIDGDHSYTGVENDCLKSEAPDRRIIFHDYWDIPKGQPRDWIKVKSFLDERFPASKKLVPGTSLAYVDL
jgi:precorrin-6B methylase 2